MSIRTVAIGAALVAAGALAATAVASRTGSAASTQKCFDFTVVQPDPQAQFSAGVYHRQNFSPGNSLSCNTTYDLFRSYLYDPKSLRGWTAGPLTGSLRNAIGKRFVKNGTGGSTGFNIYRNGRPPSPRSIVRTVNLQPGTTQTYTTAVPTRTADVGETTSLVNADGAQIVSSGFNYVGSQTVYFANVRTPNLVGFQGKVRFQITVQQATR